MPLEYNEATFTMMQAIDRALIMILMARLAADTKRPEHVVDEIFDTIREELTDDFKEQIAQQNGSFVFETLAETAEASHATLADEIISYYKESIKDMLPPETIVPKQSKSKK